jgi:hypothetical protein
MGLQVQSVLARVSFPHEETRGLISNSRGTVVKALFNLVRQPAKQSPCLAYPTPPSSCQPQGVEYK